MSETTGPLSLRSVTLARLTVTTSEPMTAGNWNSLAFSRLASETGASVAPKSTVRLVICVTPPPEPIA